MMPMAAWAAVHQSMGLAVFPVTPGQKAPPLVGWSQAASRTAREQLEFWDRWPTANIGVACRQSDIVVLDFDLPKTGLELQGTRWAHLYDNGRQPDGLDTFAAYCRAKGQDFPFDTYTVVTRSGGCQQYWRVPPGLGIGNVPPVPMVDIRGIGNTKSCLNGGYVIGVGSVVVERDRLGSTTKVGSYNLDGGIMRPIGLMPGWLLRELVILNERAEAPADPRSNLPAWADPRGGDKTAGRVRAVQEAAEGQTNHVLYTTAFGMADDGISVDEALSLLLPAYGGGRGARGGEVTVRSAYAHLSR